VPSRPHPSRSSVGAPRGLQVRGRCGRASFGWRWPPIPARADAVDHAVMDLVDEALRPAAGLDEGHLPRRPIQRQWNRKPWSTDAGDRGFVSRGRRPVGERDGADRNADRLPRRETQSKPGRRNLTIAGEPGHRSPMDAALRLGSPEWQPIRISIRAVTFTNGPAARLTKPRSPASSTTCFRFHCRWIGRRGR